MDKIEYVVYLIVEQPFAGRAKIGKSKNVKKRLATLQTGNPVKLSILYTITCDSVEAMNNLEREFHTLAKDRRLVGEWFQLSLSEIEKLYIERQLDDVAGGELHAAEVDIENRDGNVIIVENGNINGDHNVVNNVINIIMPNVDPENKRQCQNCGKIFTYEKDLLRHKNRKTPCLIRGVAVENVANPNRCKFCNKVFSKKNNLNSHLKICRFVR